MVEWEGSPSKYNIGRPVLDAPENISVGKISADASINGGVVKRVYRYELTAVSPGKYNIGRIKVPVREQYATSELSLETKDIGFEAVPRGSSAPDPMKLINTQPYRRYTGISLIVLGLVLAALSIGMFIARKGSRPLDNLSPYDKTGN